MEYRIILEVTPPSRRDGITRRTRQVWELSMPSMSLRHVVFALSREHTPKPPKGVNVEWVDNSRNDTIMCSGTAFRLWMARPRIERAIRSAVKREEANDRFWRLKHVA